MCKPSPESNSLSSRCRENIPHIQFIGLVQSNTEFVQNRDAIWQPIANPPLAGPRRRKARPQVGLSTGGHVPWCVRRAQRRRGGPREPCGEGQRGRRSPRPSGDDAAALPGGAGTVPPASRLRGVEAAFWLPPAWSTVNNVPAVSADKPSLMRLQQKHSNMHYRTSAGIFIFFFLELVLKKMKDRNS